MSRIETFVEERASSAEQEEASASLGVKMARWPAMWVVVVALLLSVELVVAELEGSSKYFKPMNFPHPVDGLVATSNNFESAQDKVRDW